LNKSGFAKNKRPFSRKRPSKNAGGKRGSKERRILKKEFSGSPSAQPRKTLPDSKGKVPLEGERTKGKVRVSCRGSSDERLFV